MARRSRATKTVAAPKASITHISRFARVSKRSVVGKSSIGKAVAENIVATKVQEIAIEIVVPPKQVAPAPTTSKKKRKAGAAVDTEDASIPELSLSNSTLASSTRPVKRLRRQPAPGTSSREQLPQTELDGDVSFSEQAGVLLERLSLQPSPSTRSSSSFTSSASITSACDSDIDLDAPFPQELLDLINLHASFLKTVAIHFVHNGTNTPVDVRAISPSIAQNWGKRRVTVEDIRLCIGVEDLKPRRGSIFDTSAANKSPFFLSDYGRGKVCIEMRQEAASGPLGFGEERLRERFETNLRSSWSNRTSATAAQFITGLPRAPITTCSSFLKASPLLAKGQQRLEDLKSGIAALKQEKENKAAAQAAAATAMEVDRTKMSLLDRIRHRQLLESTGPAPHTPAELERRAALQRVGDVADVLAMLLMATARGQKRVSFTMAAVLKRLRESLRVPVSREEGAACVRLLAREVAPEWMSVVTVAGRENVVCMTDFTPNKTTVQERVKAISE